MDLGARVKNILLSPSSEWPVIAEEPADIRGLYRGYIVPVSAIPPVAGLIGGAVFLHGMGLGLGVVGAAVSYLLGLVGIYVVALIAAKLAPVFGGRENLTQALKLVAYAGTATWVGGVFRIVPFLGLLSLLMTLYGLYLLYLGASVTVGVPRDRAVGYTVAVIVATIIVVIAVSVITGALVGAGMTGMI
jgi:hypothetical protein